MVKKKKVLKKPKKDKSHRNFDIQRIKKLIKEELYSKYPKKNKNNKEDLAPPLLFQNREKEQEKDYYIKYTKYMSEEFNSTLVNMFITYINRNKYFPIEYQKESNFINKFINLIKRLLMNEFELSGFTIIIDKIGWIPPNIDHWTYFCILGIYSKKLVGNEEDSGFLIDIFSNKNSKFIDYYLGCEEEITKKFDEKSMTIKLINERYRQLTRPINSFCRKNFINYNGVVDKIVKWSQPYGEESNGNQLYNNEKINLDNNKNNNNNDFNDLPKFLVEDTNYLDNYPKEFNNNNNKPYMFNNNSFYNNNNINNIYFQPYSNSNLFNEQPKNNINNQNIVRYDIFGLNKQSNIYPSLNLINRPSSQMSLKLENKPSNSSFNNY